MSNKNIFKKGSIEMIVLILLQKEDCYGYQITQAISEQSLGLITITEGSLYPALYRLSDRGYISCYKKLVGKRMTRVYYHLEEEGRVYLQSLLSDYLEVERGIHEIFSENNVDLSEKNEEKIN